MYVVYNKNNLKGNNIKDKFFILIMKYKGKCFGLSQYLNEFVLMNEISIHKVS